MNRFRLIAFALLALAVSGCVEGEVTYAVNPDGSAKVRVDVVTVRMAQGFGGPPPGGKKPAPPTAEGMLRDSVRAFLEMPKVVAWKDVSAEFLPSGKLKFSGTAYVKQVADFDLAQSNPLLSTAYAAERADGGLRLVRKQNGPGGNDVQPNKWKPRTPDEIKKMTDAELDNQILLDRIEIQSSKPFLAALITDANLKTTYALPGEPTAVTGFVRDGRKVSYTINGKKILDAVEKLLAEDRAAVRKRYREATDTDFLSAMLFGEGAENASAAVAKVGEAQFDFDKEVKDARAAYPALRKKFGFGDDLRLPTGENPPEK